MTHSIQLLYFATLTIKPPPVLLLTTFGPQEITPARTRRPSTSCVKGPPESPWNTTYHSSYITICIYGIVMLWCFE